VLTYVASSRWINDNPDAWTIGQVRAFLDIAESEELVGQWGTPLWLAWAISLIVWNYNAHILTTGWIIGERRWKKGWTIGGWFIPVGFLFIPILVTRETERIVLSRTRAHLVSRGDYRTINASLLGPIWFALSWIVIALRRMSTEAGLDITESYRLAMLASVMGCFSTIVALKYFGGISQGIQIGTISLERPSHVVPGLSRPTTEFLPIPPTAHGVASIDVTAWKADELAHVISSLSILQVKDPRYGYKFDGTSLESLWPDLDNEFTTVIDELLKKPIETEFLYALSDWTDSQVTALTTDLLKLKIPFSMASGELVIDAKYESVVDPIVVANEPHDGTT